MEEVVDADYVYVMEKGKIVMDGTPRDIFSRVDELKEHRLDVPQATLVADELRSAGAPIPQGILTRKKNWWMRLCPWQMPRQRYAHRQEIKDGRNHFRQDQLHIQRRYCL